MIEFTLPQAEAVEGKPAISVAELAAPPDLARAIGTAEAAYLGFRVTVVSVRAMGIGLSGYDGSLLVRDRAATAMTTRDGGRVLELRRTAELSAFERWVETADPLHFGDFAGLWSKAVWFVFGLLLSSLSLTGAYLHVKRRQRREEGGRLRTPIFLSYAATVAILVLSVRYGMLEIADYGPEGAWPEAATGVWVVIGLWIASTLAALTLWMRAVR